MAVERDRRAPDEIARLGDVELLNGFGRHCPDVRTRVAGASCLVDARR